MSRPSTVGTALVLAILIWPRAARAEDPAPATPSKLAVHGYLTQAYAISDGHTILGIPEEGTTDYRTLALQLRYALSDKDTFVVQFSHERFGQSAFAGLKPEVELDWGFYERRFSDALSLKAGKVQIPLGIYNEVRDVGTLLPFYRPPYNFYGEGAYTSETVDGVLVSYSFAPGSRWSPSVDLYFGGWDLIEVDPSTTEAFKGRAKDDLGGQVWLETPLKGLRVGGGAARFTLRDQLLAPPAPKVTVKLWHASVDGVFNRFTARGEYEEVRFPPGHYRTGSGHVGVKIARKLSVNLQADIAHLLYAFPVGVTLDRSISKDYALGVSYAFRTTLVAKVEAHRTRGLRIDEPVDLFGPPLKTNYAILSFSTSF